jgi:hypothetical protein
VSRERRRLWGVASALFGLAFLAGCSSATGPTAGTLKLSLSTPHSDDGGLLLTISGGPVDSIEATGHRLFLFRPDPNTVQLIVAGGELGAEPIARIHIPDTRQASRYAAEIGQVAARSSYTVRDPAQYTVTLLP